MANEETKLQAAILQTLQLRYRGELLIWRQNAGVVMIGEGKFRRPFQAAPKGASDLLGVLRPPVGTDLVGGRVVSLEVKLTKGKVTATQRDWLQSIRDHGGFAAVVRSVDAAVQSIKRAKMGESK